MSLSRSSLALQWSIEKLLQNATGLCGFYTLTVAEIMPWKEVGFRHSEILKAMSRDVKRRKLPRFAGVRVFEEGDRTHRPHAHWVMCPRMPQHVIQHYADMAGMGHVWLDYRYASEYLGMYLAKYLSKQRGSLRGVRRWGCFGELSGVKVTDVELESPTISLFRAVRKDCLSQGMPPTQAYGEAVRRVNCAKYGIVAVTTQLAPSVERAGEMERTTIWSDGRVTRTVFRKKT